MRLSVLVPSYRRTADLARCLAALGRQQRPPDHVVVVARAGDAETFELLRDWHEPLPLDVVTVDVPGQVQALNAGLARCSGDIVAITDDDAAPWPQWLARIERHFASDTQVAGVGGRDWLYTDGVADQGKAAIVGRVRWFGRVVGNHHRGHGAVREVDILKGANCAFRMSAIRPLGFDTRLKGAGAQVHNDMLICLALRRRGWKLLYDPEAAVDHYPGKRHDRDQRQKLNLEATIDRGYNLRLALSELPAGKRHAALLWQLVVGTREAPGLVWVLRHRLQGRKNVWPVYQAGLAGWRQAAEAIKPETMREPA